MSAGLRGLEQQADWVLVEGAGGWFTPLSDTFTFADWVTQEQLPVILVVGVKLGCINHAMLTAQAIQHAGLTLAGWVANDVTPPGKRHAEYMTTAHPHDSRAAAGRDPRLQKIQKMRQPEST